MPHKKLAKKKVLILFFSMYLLLGGLVFTLDQASQRQANRSMAATNCGVTSEQLKIKAVEQEAFNKINQYRVQNGKKALTWSPELKVPAAWLSKDMAAKGYLEHGDSLGRGPEDRMKDCGVDPDGGWAENISRKSELTANAVFEGWRNSPGHNSNMLSADSNIAAIAVETNGGKSYWTLNLAEGIETSPSPEPTDEEPSDDPDDPDQPDPSDDPDNPDEPDPSEEPEPTVRREPTPTTGPIGVDVLVSAKVQVFGIGRDGNPSPRQLTRRVTAAVYGVDRDPVAVGNAFLTYNATDGAFTGVIHLGKLEQGAYFVKLFTDTSLQTLVKPEFQMLMIDKVNPLPPVTLYQGDITRDNIINLEDYNAVLPCFQDKRCETQSAIDFNDDGLTDVKDYNLLLRSFGQQLGN